MDAHNIENTHLSYFTRESIYWWPWSWKK